MNSYKSTTELKSIARGLLLGKYSVYIAAMAIIEMIIFAVTLIVSLALPTGSVWGMLLNLAISLIIELITAVFSIGLIYFTLNICRNRAYKMNDVFYGFSSHPDKAIICKFVFLAGELICLLPAILFSALYYITENPALMIVLALLLIIGGSVIIFLHLNYGFVFYTLLDYPDASVMQLFRYCGDVMRGHRIKLFYLYASFLPLYVLGVISCGIGLFFVIPYQKVSIAQFYLDVFYVNDEESA